MTKTDNNGPKGTTPFITMKMTSWYRPGIKPTHFRIKSNWNNIKENPRLAPGVRVNDMPFEPVIQEPSSDGYHDLSSDIGDSARGNTREIFDMDLFYRELRARNMNHPLWTDPQNRQYLLDVTHRARRRDRQREIHRRNTAYYLQQQENQIKNAMYRQRMRSTYMSEAETERDRENILQERMYELERSGRQGQVGHSVLPPPPPVPQDPIKVIQRRSQKLKAL